MNPMSDRLYSSQSLPRIVAVGVLVVWGYLLVAMAPHLTIRLRYVLLAALMLATYVLLVNLNKAERARRYKLSRNVLSTRPFEAMPVNRLQEWLHGQAAFAVLTTQTQLDTIIKNEINEIYEVTTALSVNSTRQRQRTVGYRYFTVFETTVSGSLPQVFLVSRYARSRLKRYSYYKKQSVMPSYAFNKYFLMYAPPSNDSSGLDFITPDVAKLMLPLRKYDIEVRHGKLYIYAPLLSNENLIKLHTHASALASALRTI